MDWVLCYFLLCLCSVYTGTSYTCMYFIARRKECERIYVFYTAVNIAIYKEVPKWNWTKIINVSISNVNETADGVNYWIDKYIKLLKWNQLNSLINHILCIRVSVFSCQCFLRWKTFIFDLNSTTVFLDPIFFHKIKNVLC